MFNVFGDFIRGCFVLSFGDRIGMGKRCNFVHCVSWLSFTRLTLCHLNFQSVAFHDWFT